MHMWIAFYTKISYVNSTLYKSCLVRLLTCYYLLDRINSINSIQQRIKVIQYLGFCCTEVLATGRSKIESWQLGNRVSALLLCISKKTKVRKVIAQYCRTHFQVESFYFISVYSSHYLRLEWFHWLTDFWVLCNITDLPNINTYKIMNPSGKGTTLLRD